MAPSGAGGRRRRRPNPLFLLLLSQGAATAAAFIAPVPPPSTGPGTAPSAPAPAARGATRRHSIHAGPSSSSAVSDPGGGLDPALMTTAVAAAAAAPLAPPRPSIGGGSPRSPVRSHSVLQPAPLPPLPSPLPPLVVDQPPPARAWPEEERPGWRAAERRLRGLLEEMGRDVDGAALVDACRSLLQASIDDDEAAAGAVAWAVQDVLLAQRQEDDGDDGALWMLAFRACAATGAAEAAVALFLNQPPPPIGPSPQSWLREEALDLALEACARRSSRPDPLGEARTAALSLVRAAGAASPSVIERAAAAMDGDGTALASAAGALRLLIGEVKRGAGGVPAWLYTRAMRAALAQGEEAQEKDGAAGPAAVVSLLYEEALASGGSATAGEGGEEGLMALHEAALAAYAAQGHWSAALAVLERLRTGGKAPSLTCFNHAVQACCLAGEWERGAGLLQRMEGAGHAAGEETYLGILQALGKAGQWQGALRLLDHVTAAKKGGVTPAMARAAAGICVKAGKFAEARRLVDAAISSSSASGDSPELLELGLWALVAAAGPVDDTPPTEAAEAAAGLIQRLMALSPDAGISLDAYEHASQALARSPDPRHEALLRSVYRHAVFQGAIPPLAPSSPMDLRGLRPTLARVALAEALVQLVGDDEDDQASQEATGGERPPLVLITGTGAIKASVRRFLRSKGSFGGFAFCPLPMPYNHGRLLLPWPQLRRWRAAGASVCLSIAAAGEEEGVAGTGGGGDSRRRQRLWGGMDG